MIQTKPKTAAFLVFEYGSGSENSAKNRQKKRFLRKNALNHGKTEAAPLRGLRCFFAVFFGCLPKKTKN